MGQRRRAGGETEAARDRGLGALHERVDQVNLVPGTEPFRYGQRVLLPSQPSGPSGRTMIQFYTKEFFEKLARLLSADKEWQRGAKATTLKIVCSAIDRSRSFLIDIQGGKVTTGTAPAHDQIEECAEDDRHDGAHGTEVYRNRDELPHRFFARRHPDALHGAADDEDRVRHGTDPEDSEDDVQEPQNDSDEVGHGPAKLSSRIFLCHAQRPCQERNRVRSPPNRNAWARMCAPVCRQVPAQVSRKRTREVVSMASCSRGL